MHEQAHAMCSIEPANDTDVDFGGLAAWVSCSDTFAEGCQVEPVNAINEVDGSRLRHRDVPCWVL